MEIHQFKKSFDPLLQSFLDKKLKSFSDASNKEVLEYLNYLKMFLAEGKRLRPYLAYLTYKAYGGKKDRETLNILVFLELLHAFLLIHDDIMDKAEKRHNIPTAHKFISEKVRSLKRIDPDYFGISQAICLGDYLYAWAYEILNENKDFNEKILKKIRTTLAITMDKVILGQMLDLNTTLYEMVSKEEILNKLTLKTAYYSFINPMKVGVSLTGRKVNDKFFEDLGTFLGVAFQTQDDLLDIAYNENQTHKSSFNDIEQRQQTFFTNFIYTKGSLKDQEILSKYFGEKLTSRDKKLLRKVFEESGAIAYGEKIMKENFDKAKNTLMKQEINQEYKDLFMQLVEKIERRTN